MEKNIAVIRGDGIGPEIVNATLQVLAAVGEKFIQTLIWAAAPLTNMACR